MLDALLAAGVLAVGAVGWSQRPHALDSGAYADAAFVLTTIAVQSAALAWRRRAPQLVFVVVLAVCVVQWSLRVIVPSDIAMMISLYAVARYAERRLLPWAIAATLASLPVAAFRATPLQHQPLLGLFFLTTAATAGATLGLVARNRQVQLAALADRATHLELEREQRVRLATLAERARVSREMHDIVGHSLAIIVGLADGGAIQVAANPERGAQALHIIADTARQALTELRRTLGALRERPLTGTGDEEPELSPQPGAADLARLLDRVRAAGPRVGYRTAGDLSVQAPGVQLAVYRIIQEALTNSLKHAGAHTTVSVTLEIDDREIRVAVEDTGPPQDSPASHRDTSEGQGLVGIHERAALASGTAHTGPRPDGGWTVRAVLPLSPNKEQP
ncbi:sensor histidine kinase [Streptomyces sp. NPDC059649]|uniref:sensor histidine kinase n=1 Tax=Streptomyces sp. NPDC059649 TaxID=3346895 RepID=UPI0036A569F3